MNKKSKKKIKLHTTTTAHSQLMHSRGAGSKGAGSAASSPGAAAGSIGSGYHGVDGLDGGVGGYDMMGEDEQPKDSGADVGLKGAVKRTRVEGR